MASVAAHSAAATFVIIAVAGGAVIKSHCGNGTVKGLAILVKPGLPGRVSDCCMAVMATGWGIPIKAILCMAGITDSHFFSLNGVISTAMNPTGTARHLGT